MRSSGGTTPRFLEKAESALRELGFRAGSRAGLLPSVLALDGGTIWRLPQAVPGQRQSDRAFPGTNLMHDHSAIRAMLELARAGRGEDFAGIGRTAISRFVTHCCVIESGLFPWGEHAFWSFADECPGNSYALDCTADSLKHDHLLQAPEWLWEEIANVSADKVLGFADGLDNHWRTNDPAEYNRHAPLVKRGRIANPDPISCDFPRHAGFYALDWAMAFRLGHKAEHAKQIRDISDYWWAKRAKGRALPLSSRVADKGSSYTHFALQQTLSFGVSLLEVSALLAEIDPGLARDCLERGASYIEAAFREEHDPAQGKILFRVPLPGIPGDAVPAQLWGSVYGDQTAATFGLLLLRAEGLLGGRREYLDFCSRLAASYPPLPSWGTVPAKDAGQVISFLTEVAVKTGDMLPWNKALEFAEDAAAAFLDRRLPRAGTGLDWYESQMLPGYLLSALARLGCIEREPSVARSWGADFSLR